MQVLIHAQDYLRLALQLPDLIIDLLNYVENVLSAARALEQINNQIRQLQNQAQMVLRMDQNLQRLGTTLSPDLQRALSDIQARLQQGVGIALKLQQTETGYAQLYPKELSSALSTDDVLRNAKSRWDEEYASLKRSALLQGLIGDNLGIRMPKGFMFIIFFL